LFWCGTFRTLGKTQAKLASDRENQNKDPPIPPGSVLKTQKRDLLCVGNFFASSLFRAAITLTERRADVRFTPKSGQLEGVTSMSA
jgi:hypothetical protein